MITPTEIDRKQAAEALMAIFLDPSLKGVEAPAGSVARIAAALATARAEGPAAPVFVVTAISDGLVKECVVVTDHDRALSLFTHWKGVYGGHNVCLSARAVNDTSTILAAPPSEPSPEKCATCNGSKTVATPCHVEGCSELHRVERCPECFGADEATPPPAAWVPEVGSKVVWSRPGLPDDTCEVIRLSGVPENPLVICRLRGQEYGLHVQELRPAAPEAMPELNAAITPTVVWVPEVGKRVTWTLRKGQDRYFGTVLSLDTKKARIVPEGLEHYRGGKYGDHWVTRDISELHPVFDENSPTLTPEEDRKPSASWAPEVGKDAYVNEAFVQDGKVVQGAVGKVLEERPGGRAFLVQLPNPNHKAWVLRSALRPAQPEARPVCSECNDTHRMHIEEGFESRGVPCTHCPVPCQKCRRGGNGPYCENTPCDCVCHAERRAGLQAQGVVASPASMSTEPAQPSENRPVDGPPSLNQSELTDAPADAPALAAIPQCPEHPGSCSPNTCVRCRNYYDFTHERPGAKLARLGVDARKWAEDFSRTAAMKRCRDEIDEEISRLESERNQLDGMMEPK